MRNLFLGLAYWVMIPMLSAQSSLAIPASIASSIPTNWKLLLSRAGDLNKDSYEDRAIIIEEQNDTNRIANESLGPNQLNINPRRLLVFFGTKNGDFRLVDGNSRGFIPSENDKENPCMEDPIAETEGIELKKGLLKVHFNYWQSCGSWYTTAVDYTFRYQYATFQLIGLDTSSYHRSTGDEEQVSMNFSTRTIITTTGGNIFNTQKDHPKNTTKHITSNTVFQLKDCTGKLFEKLQNLY
jgi:hypothetical protein